MSPFINEKSITRLKFELEKLHEHVLLGFGSTENNKFLSSLECFQWGVSPTSGVLLIDYSKWYFAGTGSTSLYIIHKDQLHKAHPRTWIVPDSIRHLVPSFKSNEITRTLTL